MSLGQRGLQEMQGSCLNIRLLPEMMRCWLRHDAVQDEGQLARHHVIPVRGPPDLKRLLQQVLPVDAAMAGRFPLVNELLQLL